MTSRLTLTSLAALAFFSGAPLAAAQAPDAQSFSAPQGMAMAPDAPPYAELADLVVASPLIIDATIRSATRIKGAEAAGLPAGDARFYVEAQVGALVRGGAAIPAQVGWLVDVHPDASGRIPRLKKARVIAFARPVPGRPGQLQLVATDAQRIWSPGTDTRVRAIAAEAAGGAAPPVVTGVKSAFHVAGSLPGEGETQIFLATSDNRPAALSIVRRPGETPRWSVALSELIDDSATAPRHNTLLWYRLACFLPPALPEAATAALEPADATQAQQDYRLVLEQLGTCRPGGAGSVSAGAGPA